jgi:uncharacterized protein (DUF433 family)
MTAEGIGLPPFPSRYDRRSCAEATENANDHDQDHDAAVCGGEPVIKGTRVTLRTVLASLAEGADVKDILVDFPTLTADDVKAVIAFAASSAEEDLPVSAVQIEHERQAG